MKINWLVIMTGTLVMASCKQGPAGVKFDSTDKGSSNVRTESTLIVPPNALSFTTALPRLTADQWENSVKDVLLLDTTPNKSSLFPADPQKTIFANDGNSLAVSDGLWQSYVKASEEIAESLVSKPAQVSKLVPSEAAALSGDAKAKAIIKPLATRAFRRPPSDAQMNRLIALYKNGPMFTGNADPVAAGLQAVVHNLLQSPFFVYRVELGSKNSPLTSLTAWEVASRLSYAAWNTIPDAELLKAAETGEILTDSGLEQQARRLMSDKRADKNLAAFYRTIFGTDTYKDVEKKDLSIVKSWPDDIGKTLVKEAELFIDEVIIKEDGGLNQLLTAPYAFVNSQTAAYYGIEPPKGTDFVKTNLNPKERIGILTQVGFLARKSHAKDSNAIKRGVLISDKLLCSNITENVPPNIPEIPPSKDKQTARDVINLLSGPGTCGGACHTGFINPAGFAFENYDAAGQFRTTDNSMPVNAADTLLLTTGPVKYDGPHEFVKTITASKDLHRCLVEKAVGYLFAREVDEEDVTLINNIALKSADNIATRELFIQVLIDTRIKIRGNKGK